MSRSTVHPLWALFNAISLFIDAPCTNTSTRVRDTLKGAIQRYSPREGTSEYQYFVYCVLRHMHVCFYQRVFKPRQPHPTSIDTVYFNLLKDFLASYPAVCQVYKTLYAVLQRVYVVETLPITERGKTRIALSDVYLTFQRLYRAT